MGKFYCFILSSFVPIFFIFSLIANIIFSAAFSDGQYGGVVIIRISYFSKNLLLGLILWIVELSHIITTLILDLPIVSVSCTKQTNNEVRNYLAIIWILIEHNTIKMILWECKNWGETEILIVWRNIGWLPL